MKLISVVVLCAAGIACATARAQNSVTLYGIVDTGVEFVTHANAAGDSLVRMPAITGSLPSRIGFKGTEDLGGGYRAQFQLENGFNLRGGDLGQGGRLFGRQAWVGVGGPVGMLSFGRQYTATYLVLLENSLIGPSLYNGIGTLDAYTSNARADNSVVYRGTFAGLTAFGSYSFGRDSTGTGNSPGQGICAGSLPGDYRACKDWSVMLKYDAPNFGVGMAYEEQHGGPGATASFLDGVPAIQNATSGDRDARLIANGYAKVFDVVRLAAGYVNRRVSTDGLDMPTLRSNLFYLEVSYRITPAFLIDGGVYRIVNAEHDTRATTASVRGMYFLSKTTAVYGQLGFLANSRVARYSLGAGGLATPPVGANQTGIMVGIRNMF